MFNLTVSEKLTIVHVSFYDLFRSSIRKAVINDQILIRCEIIQIDLNTANIFCFQYRYRIITNISEIDKIGFLSCLYVL